MMEDTEEGYRSRWPILSWLVNTLLAPIQVATSPAFLRTYLRTLLILLASIVLFGVSVLAYTTLYLSYIPVRGITVPIYLQYDLRQLPSIPSFYPKTSPGIQFPHTSEQVASTTTPASKHPYGIANINGLVSRQKYDVSVELVLPRSAKNLDAGNWMVGIEMRAPVTAGGGVKQMLGYGEEWEVEDFSEGGEAGTAKGGFKGSGDGASGAATAESGTSSPSTSGEKEKAVVLARSRRPAILKYRSWVTEMAWRIVRLPFYVFGWWDESEKVEVGMMEAVEFEKGWRNIPSSVRLEVRSRTALDVYAVRVKFVARLEGMRWLMYHYWITSLVAFTGLFWIVEMTILLVTWALFSFVFGGSGGDSAYGAESDRRIKKEKRIKSEDGGDGTATPRTEASTTPSTPLSDTSRTFPTLPSQQPLQYSSPTESTDKRIKEERGTPSLDDIPRATEAEADDEDEEDDFLLEEPIPPSAVGAVTDSGIGTSMESGREGDRGLVRRRSGKRER